MNVLRLLAAGVMVSTLTAGVRAEKKADNAALIVGTWEVSKADKGTVAVGSVVEFTKDGKMKIDDKEKDRKLEGTYKVDGDKFTFTVKVEGEERKKTITIKKISDKELSTADELGKNVEFTRKK